MKKFIYILAVSMFGMMGCSEDTITYINPTPGEEPSEVIAELGISSKNTWFTPADGLNAAIGFNLPWGIAYPVGAVCVVAYVGIICWYGKKRASRLRKV